jgi:hypothetical protein
MAQFSTFAGTDPPSEIKYLMVLPFQIITPPVKAEVLEDPRKKELSVGKTTIEPPHFTMLAAGLDFLRSKNRFTI